MGFVDWRVSGPELTTCNCNWGCPCQFNGLPSHGDCRAAVAMRVDEGHFGDTPLSGLLWAGLFAWPGAIHEGNGEAQPIVDPRADEAQKRALLTILSGQEAEPGSGVFNVFMSTMTKIHPPIFAPIVFESDMERRTGSFSVAGVVEVKGEPIRNRVTGAEQRVGVSMPGGFEFLEAQFASGSAKASGAIALDWQGRHAHFADLNMGPQGPIR